MKNIIKCLFLVFLIGFMSCRETKNEVVESDVVIENKEKIEAIEAEVDEISEEIKKETKKIENELDELDKL